MNRHEDALVSVIIPVYNIAPYIKECIESIQKQSYRNIEIVIIDDGSIDGSGELCEGFAEHDERIQVIRQKNAGVAAARSKGIEASVGTYMMFVDGDDWIESNMVEQLVKQLNSADLVTSGVYYQEKADKIIERYDVFLEGLYSTQTQIDQILKSMIYDAKTGYLQRLTPWCYNKLYRSDLVKEIYQDVDLDITFAEDSVFLYKYLLRCNSIVVIHQCYYHYRYREGSAMHGINDHMLIDINKVYLALEEDFRNHKLSQQLLFQLQKWIIVMCCRALNFHMGFEKEACVQEFIADLSHLNGKALVLYGAGQVGQNTYRQLKGFGFHVVLWVDKNYKLYQRKGLPVVSPDEIFNQEYDVVFIAVNEEDLADKISRELSERGISSDRQIWKKPMRV